ncbi:MAG: hypothetical protein IPL74_15230 [Bacteroidetes bacterium]|nr:hypothetical protein [Bacteroidota bacterium]
MPIQNDGVYIAKYSNVGNYVWGGVVVGASVGLWPRDIKTDAYENVYVAMYSFRGTIDFDNITAGVNNMNTVNGVPCLLKLNSAGAFLVENIFHKTHGRLILILLYHKVQLHTL